MWTTNAYVQNERGKAVEKRNIDALDDCDRDMK